MTARCAKAAAALIEPAAMSQMFCGIIPFETLCAEH
jgi:hypothetical protein